MASAQSWRLQKRPSAKYFRKRRDSEEENIYLDPNRDGAEITQEVLFNVVNHDISNSKKLGYLNSFVKLCTNFQTSLHFGFSYKDIFICLRISFLHEICEVRAAGLRACRHLLQNEEALEAFYQIKLQFFVSRSLDLLLDNRIERIQALRLMRKVLCLNPQTFPRAFTNSLVAVVNEGAQERDLIRPCLATLAQLTLLNPKACVEANGINSLIRSVLECSQPQTAEAILGVILFLINNPSTRSLINNEFGLEHLLAPFTDCHYYSSALSENATSDDNDNNLKACKAAIVCVMHSWAGLSYLCRTECFHLQSLIEMLYLPYADLRKNILDLLYQIFDIPIPEWTNDFTAALVSTDPSAVKSSWQLYEDYVVAEGLDILPYTSSDRTNLVQNYYALLLLVFVNSGILDALAKVIVSSEIYLAVRATIFLGEFIYLANQLLPINCSHLSNCLPTLITSAAASDKSKEQNQATGALTCLYRIHELKKHIAVPNSLVLSNLLHICKPDREKKGFFAGTVSRMKLWQYLRKDVADTIELALKDTQVLAKEFYGWDWDLIDCILKNPNDSLKKLEDINQKTFIKKLLIFFKPSSKEFSEMELDRDYGRQICNTGCHFLEFLIELEEPKAREYLDELLSDINACLEQVTKDSDRLNAILSPMKVLNTFSQKYFLFIGKLSSSHKGCKFLHRCNTFQNLLHLVSVTNQDIYIKLVVSALDYTKEGFARVILNKVLTGTQETARLYATKFLRILLRAGMPDFHKWTIEVLVTQLYDPSKIVSCAAIDILDEACNIRENLETLISIRPSLLHMGDKGLLLLLRFLSSSNGFRFLRESGFLNNELERWQNSYNLKYVKIVEDLLNESFTHHRKSSDGTYGRRTSDPSHSLHNVFLPPHIYGELVQHTNGLEDFEKIGIFQELCKVIYYPDYSSESSILSLKGSLWAMGHIGSHLLGLGLIQKEGLLPSIVHLASNAPVLAVRGTCYFVLGLLGSTPEGAAALREFGWEAVERNHKEKWPLIKEEHYDECMKCARKSACSFSSVSSEWPTGGLPMNFSFVVQTSNLDLSASQSSYGSSGDILQSYDENKSIIEHQTNSLINNPSFASRDIRPRSSSEYQSERNDSVLFEITESASWDVLNYDSSYSPPKTFNQYMKRRSISSSEVERKIFSLSDDNISKENFSLEETNSLPKSSYNTTNFLNESRHNSLDGSNTIYPMVTVSDSTIVTSSKMFSNFANRPNLLKHLSQGHSFYLKTPSPEDSPPVLLTSSRDAHGYAALKDIQKRRVSSLSFHGSSSFDVDLPRYMKSQSLDAEAANSYVMNMTHSDSSLSESEDSLRFTVPSQCCENQEATSNIRYIGLSLPSDLSFIFSVPKMENEVTSEFSDSFTTSKDHQESKDNVFEFHTDDNCISNHFFNGKRDLMQIIIDEENEESEVIPPKTTEKIIHSTSRSNSIKGLSKSRDDCLNSKYLIRKEAMRFVTNLCSSIAVKSSEQGLLNLKQKFPEAFQDICLYTEINYYMANYNFRLPARRFMQELFLDATFEQLQQEAEAIVGIINIPQIGGSEA